LATRYDVVISTAPPWSAHLAAAAIARARQIPLILDDRDPWLDSPGRLLLITHPKIRARDRRLAETTYAQAQAVVTVSAPATARLRDRRFVSSGEIVTITNGFDPTFDRLRRPAARKDKLTIIYVGSFYHGRSPSLVLDALAALEPSMARDFHVQFIGAMADADRGAADSRPLAATVQFAGRQPHQYCVEAILDADVALLLAIGQPMQVPAKLYEYIGLGRPVLSISGRQDATMQLLHHRPWAWATDAAEPRQLVNALRDIHARWQRRDLPEIPEHERQPFSFETLAKEYAALVRRVVA
jgi:glycosyltransferase involved in cell wall biosynthesis